MRCLYNSVKKQVPGRIYEHIAFRETFHMDKRD